MESFSINYDKSYNNSLNKMLWRVCSKKNKHLDRDRSSLLKTKKMIDFSNEEKLV